MGESVCLHSDDLVAKKEHTLTLVLLCSFFVSLVLRYQIIKVYKFQYILGLLIKLKVLLLLCHVQRLPWVQLTRLRQPLASEDVCSSALY